MHDISNVFSHLQAEWYAQRATLAAVYAAAGTCSVPRIRSSVSGSANTIFFFHDVELHQLNSPHSAEAFLDSLLASRGRVGAAFADSVQYASFAGRSAVGIFRSWGVV